MTGEKQYVDRAWKMFNTIIKHTLTDVAHAGIDDVTLVKPGKIDRMESFWPGETLKYFYLMFSSPEHISLDEWVLNTEAHPLKRAKEALSPS
jgi:mannosyl-oligosaccharide alpha-1,2-mannosidase